ncbi:MAG TPA: hypothetical protein EYP39_00720, partial [Ghiorsea sp.]|nr:hypothetical protein [Ghiorsea sp.]
MSVLVLLVMVAIQGDAKPNQMIAHHEWLEADALHVVQDVVEKVQSGDTAGLVLRRLGFSAAESANMFEAAKEVYPLKKIHIGHSFTRQNNPSNTIVYYQIDAENTLMLNQNSDATWQAELMQRELT